MTYSKEIQEFVKEQGGELVELSRLSQVALGGRTRNSDRL